jgi:hypothetical protein
MASTQRAYRSPDDSGSTKEAYFTAVELDNFFETCPAEIVPYRFLRLIGGMFTALEKALNKQLHGNQFEFYLSQEHYRAGGLYKSDRTVRYNLPEAVARGFLEVVHRREDGQTHHIWIRPRSERDQGEYRRVTTYRLPVSVLIRWRNWRNGHKAEVEPIRKSPEPEKTPPPAAAPAAPVPEREKPAEPQPKREQPAAAITPKPQTVVNTEASTKLEDAAKRLMDICGLPDIGNTATYIGAAILAESKFQGVEIEDAAKHLSDCVLRDQRNGVTVGLFYCRDTKWRSNGGGQPQTAAAGRAERSKQSLTSAWHKFKAESERSGTGPPDSLNPNQLKE